MCFRGRIKQIRSNKQISSTEFDLICNLILSLKHTKLNPSPQPIAYGGGGNAPPPAFLHLERNNRGF